VYSRLNFANAENYIVFFPKTAIMLGVLFEDARQNWELSACIMSFTVKTTNIANSLQTMVKVFMLLLYSLYRIFSPF